MPSTKKNFIHRAIQIDFVPFITVGLYLLLDRLNLSRMNNKVDEQGNIYVFITRKEMGNLHIGKGKNTNKVLEFLQLNKIYKNKINNSYSTKRDYGDFDWTSLYANKF